jgi:hypothetical protein
LEASFLDSQVHEDLQPKSFLKKFLIVLHGQQLFEEQLSPCEVGEVLVSVIKVFWFFPFILGSKGLVALGAGV